MASKYEQFFHDADTDKDGFLSVQELTTALKKYGYKESDEKIASMFESVDDSGDRKISLDEYLTAMGALPDTHHKEAAWRHVFRQFDKNGDGQIDRSELDAIFQQLGDHATPEELDHFMKQADKDQSGTLSYEEFLAEIVGSQ